MEYDLYDNLIDSKGNIIIPGFYIETSLKPTPHDSKEKLCVVYPNENKFLAYYFSGEKKYVVCSDVWNNETEVGSMSLKPIEINKIFREATELLNFINEGLEKILTSSYFSNSLISHTRTSHKIQYR